MCRHFYRHFTKFLNCWHFSGCMYVGLNLFEWYLCNQNYCTSKLMYKYLYSFRCLRQCPWQPRSSMASLHSLYSFHNQNHVVVPAEKYFIVCFRLQICIQTHLKKQFQEAFFRECNQCYLSSGTEKVWVEGAIVVSCKVYQAK